MVMVKVKVKVKVMVRVKVRVMVRVKVKVKVMVMVMVKVKVMVRVKVMVKVKVIRSNNEKRIHLVEFLTMDSQCVETRGIPIEERGRVERRKMYRNKGVRV